MANVQQAMQALEENKVVLTTMGSRTVRVNSLVQGKYSVVMQWSHADFPEARYDDVEEGQEFVIRSEFARNR